MRTVRTLGAATIDGIAGQVRATTRSAIDGDVRGRAAERTVGVSLAGPRRRAGSGSCSVRTRCSPTCARCCRSSTRLSSLRLASVLFRTRAGPRPSPVGRPGAVPARCRRCASGRDGDRRQAARSPRPPQRRGVARRAASSKRRGGGLSDAQLRWLVREIGLPWTPIWRLLRSSPLFEQSPEGLFRLVGSS